MMAIRLILIFSLCIIDLCCYAQSFSKYYDLSKGFNVGKQLLAYDDGYILMATAIGGNISPYYNTVILDVDKCGEIKNKTLLDSIFTNLGLFFEANEISVIGVTSAGINAFKKLNLYKTNLQGAILNCASLSFPLTSHYSKICSKINSELYIEEANIGLDDLTDTIKLLVFDTSFNYKKSIICPHFSPRILTQSTTVHNSNNFVTGISQQEISDGLQKNIVVAYDSLGNQLWKYTENEKVKAYYSATIRTVGFSDKSTAVLMAYPFDNTLFPMQKLIKFDESGKVVWEYKDTYQFNTGEQDIYDICVTKNNDILLAGTKEISIQDINHGLIMKLNSNGNLVWKKNVIDNSNSDENHEFLNVIELENDSILLTGLSGTKWSSTNFKSNVWLIKLDSSGIFKEECSNITSTNNIIERNYTLKLSPNPAINYVNITLQDPEGNYKYIIINDLIGREIKRYYVGNRSEEHNLNIQDLNPGIYIVKAIGVDFSEIKKFVKN